MQVQFEVPDHARLIELLLEGFINAAALLIKAGAVPSRPPLHIRLQDDEVPSWQLPSETMRKGTADCEDLIIWWAGHYRATGKDPRARARIKTVGPLQTHCLLQMGDGTVVDAYQEHLRAQAKAGIDPNDFGLSGLFSFVKSIGHGISKGAQAVGHGVSSAAHAVGRGAVAAEHGIVKGAKAVGGAAQYVAKELPKDVLHEAGSGLKSVAGGIGDFVHDIGSAGSTVVNQLGDVVAGGAQDALHQVGKLVGGIGHSVASGFGDDAKSYNGGGDGDGGDGGDAAAPAPGGDPAAGAGVPPDYPDDGGGGFEYDDGGDDEDPWAGMDELDGVPRDDDDSGNDDSGGVQ